MLASTTRVLQALLLMLPCLLSGIVVASFQFAVTTTRSRQRRGGRAHPHRQTTRDDQEVATAVPTLPVPFNAKLSTTTSDSEWRNILTPEQYNVLREQGTEAPHSSQWNELTKSNNDQSGIFCCAACGNPLFVTEAQFDSGTGWPSFVAPISNSALALTVDMKLLLPRTECACASCGGHMGHVFDDGPDGSTTGQRFCINGVAMNFVPTKSADDDDAPSVLMRQVEEAQATNPYLVSLPQVIPSLLFNILVGILFFNAYLNKMTSADFGNSPIDGLPLLPALYFGTQAFAIIRRLVVPQMNGDDGGDNE